MLHVYCELQVMHSCTCRGRPLVATVHVLSLL